MKFVRKTEPVVETRKVVLEPETYTLTFTRDELKAFFLIGQKIAGDEKDSPRAAFKALSDLVRDISPEIVNELYGRDGNEFYPLQRFFETNSSLHLKRGSIND